MSISDTFTITKDFVRKLVNNFEHSPFAPVIRGHNEAEAEKNPALILNKNINALYITDTGLDAEFEIDEKEIENYNDVSVSMDTNYVNKETGISIGPVLKHVAMVLNPYIKGLNSFVSLGDQNDLVINLSEIQSMADETTKEPEVVTEEEEEATPVATEESTPDAVEESTPETEEVKEEEEATEEEEAPEVTPESEEVEQVSDTGSVVNASETIAEQAAQIAKLEAKLKLSEANELYEKLSKQGKVTPAMKDPFINLVSASASQINLSDGSNLELKDAVLGLIEKMPVLVDFSEKGVNVEANIETDMSMFGVPHDEVMRLQKRWPEKGDEFEARLKKNASTIITELEKAGKI